ncbi:hypothetical protein JAAARDRAFT_42932, partial [Jaapia argillacea MUCL 33604]
MGSQPNQVSPRHPPTLNLPYRGPLLHMPVRQVLAPMVTPRIALAGTEGFVGCEHIPAHAANWFS